MTNLNLIAWDETTRRPKLTGKDASLVGQGAASNRTGQVALSQGDTSKSVTFDVAMTSASYTVTAIFYNSVDSSVIYQDLTITNRTTAGFNASWNYPVDSNNYELHYTASVYGYAFISGEIALSQGATSKIVPITPAFPDASYVVSFNLFNSVDSNVVYQPIALTSKTASQFVVKWNTPLSSANYSLEYQVNLL